MFTYFLLAFGIIMLILFLVARDKKSSALAIILKTATSLFFIATAVAALTENLVNLGDKYVVVPGGLVILGLALGMVGDITLDFKIYFKGLIGSYDNAEKDSDAMMYIGMIVFGVGHILYIASTATRFPGLEMNLLWSALVAIGACALLFVVSIFVLKMNFGKWLIASISYGFLLFWFFILSVWTIAQVGSTPETVIQLIASLMFLLSDMVLSMTYFSKKEDYEIQGPYNPESRVMICVNHITYYAAQFLLAVLILFM